jgi:hypothetical protein
MHTLARVHRSVSLTRHVAADAEKPDKAFLPPETQRSHDPAPRSGASGIEAERADSLRRTFGGVPADPRAARHAPQSMQRLTGLL